MLLFLFVSYKALDVEHILTLLINTIISILKVSAYIITHITACPTRPFGVGEILVVLMIVLTAVILYFTSYLY